MEKIKQKLLDMLDEISSDLNQEQLLSKNSVTTDIGDNIDHASEERERELHQLFCDRDRKKIAQIKQALERMETKSYGFCGECNEKISYKRLLAMPFTLLCLECKQEEERLHGKSLTNIESTEEQNYSHLGNSGIEM